MQKRSIIKKIKTIIEKHGSFTIADVEGESSPLIVSMGNSCVLAERFDSTVTGVMYAHDTEMGENEYEYDELPKDVLEEILSIAENYETDQEKTLKRMSN